MPWTPEKGPNQRPGPQLLDPVICFGHLLCMSEENRSIGSDNHSGIHPKILAAFMEANQGHAHSYGKDPWTRAADQHFKSQFGREIQTYYVFNGTAANVLALDALVSSHESVLCAQTSHLWQDECGAPQRLIGCQLIPIETPDGKLTPSKIHDI